MVAKGVSVDPFGMAWARTWRQARAMDQVAPLSAKNARVAVHSGDSPDAWWRRHWFLLGAAVVAAIPGIGALARNYWSTEQGAAGPIVLITGIWLLLHESASMKRVQDACAGWIVALCLLDFGMLAVVAAITAKQWLQLLGIYGCLVAVLYGQLGWRQLRRLWAPILYLAFVIPPPDNLVVPLTHALKGLAADGATSTLAILGYPVARDGVLLYIGPYELVVAAACSGMNSLVSLTAIGIFYVYVVHRANWHYAALLAVLMVPVALFANAVRVIVLLLATYYLGDETGQGVLHEIAGLFIFLVALGTLVLLDKILSRVVLRRSIGR